MKTCLMNMCARHVPYTCKNEIEWYITCLSTMVCCSSVFVVTNVLYIARILPYVSVYTHMLLLHVLVRYSYRCMYQLICCSHVLVCYSYTYMVCTGMLLIYYLYVLNHMYLNVICMYSYATCMYSYVTHKYLCGVLVMIQLTMQLQTVVTVVKFGCMGQ